VKLRNIKYSHSKQSASSWQGNLSVLLTAKEPIIQVLSPAQHLKKQKRMAGCWWLIPVILPTWESEIGRTEVQGQPRQIIHETPSPKQPDKNG
jgi:hypothetical protein